MSLQKVYGQKDLKTTTQSKAMQLPALVVLATPFHVHKEF